MQGGGKIYTLLSTVGKPGIMGGGRDLTGIVYSTSN